MVLNVCAIQFDEALLLYPLSWLLALLTIIPSEPFRGGFAKLGYTTRTGRMIFECPETETTLRQAALMLTVGGAGCQR